MIDRPTRTRRVSQGLLVAVALAMVPLACAERPCGDAHAERARLDFTLKDMGGRDVKLSDFQGRPILINFWATWCGPCKEEIPALIEFATKYKSNELAVLGISIDDGPEDLKKFAQEHKMNYPVLVGQGHDDLLEAYDAQFGVPVSWFVNACGAVTVKHQGGASKDWFEQQIKAIL